MITAQVSEMDEITQLAKTLSATCEKVVEEGKAETRISPVVTAAAVALILGATATTWP